MVKLLFNWIRRRWKMEGLKRCAANDTPLSPIGFMQRAATVYGETTSVVYNDSRFTWCQTFDRCRRLASALSSRNISRGDVVSVVAPNIPALYEMHFAVPMAGAVLNTVNIRLDARAMALQFRHCEPKFIFVDYQYLPVVVEAIKATDHKPCLVVIEEERDDHGKEYLNASPEITTYQGLLQEGDPVFEPRQPKDEWEPIVLNYTSGTTSAPKGVLNSHRATYISTMNILSMWRMQPRPVFLWTLPMFHNNGWSFPWGIAAIGGTNICLRKFDAKLIYSYIQNHGVTHFCAAPVVLSMIANASPSDRKPLPGRVEILTSGATPPSSDLLRMEELGFSVTHGYGLTESGGFVTWCAWKPQWDKLAAAARSKIRSRQGVGVLSLVQVDVKDPASMVSVPRDGKKMGEIMLRGSTVMMGYLKDERSTAKAMEGGWFHTGDLGVIHPDGYLEIKDRSKDIIISGGENISSVEVESVLHCHPMIAEAAVVGRPDPFWGETPCAFVSNRVGPSNPNLSGVTVSEAEMISFCRERLPHYMVPKTVVFMESLPKTSTGKIQKFLLREMAKRSCTETRA
jgi:acyl-CoA synthetase (AMP-forming)/AMP-acid ligase II